MTPSELEKTLDEAIVMLVNSTATKPQKTGIRERLAVLRKEMKVQAKMIDLMTFRKNFGAGTKGMYQYDDIRQRAEAELKEGKL